VSVSPDVIRAARPRDAEAILAFWREAAEAPSATDDVEGIETLLARDPSALIVAEEGGRIVGTVVAAWDGWRGRIYRLAVDPAARGRGLGRALVSIAERRLRDLGARRIDALVMTDHDGAVGFWRAIGWEHDDRVQRYLSDR
jgi:ribosomal protein S18 acetylase RimI-like enzyme